MKRPTLIVAALLWSQMALAQDIPAAHAGADRMVVFDIDGTLTPSVWAYRFARPRAADVVQAYARAGVRVIYLSARRRVFQHEMPEWLAEHGFPDAPLYLTATVEDRADNAAFKTRILTEWVDQGWHIVAAYGDSSTDFAAYGAAGIPAEHVFALRRFGYDTCLPGVYAGCHDGWADLAKGVPALIGQPRSSGFIRAGRSRPPGDRGG